MHHFSLLQVSNDSCLVYSNSLRHHARRQSLGGQLYDQGTPPVDAKFRWLWIILGSCQSRPFLRTEAEPVSEFLVWDVPTIAGSGIYPPPDLGFVGDGRTASVGCKLGAP